MSITTYFLDTKEGTRIAWQNYKQVYEWTQKEIDDMYKESPLTVPRFGTYFNRDIPIIRARSTK